jgi:dynein heavy chain
LISSLLVFEVHNRDIIQELITRDVSESDNFDWLKQLRDYLDDEVVTVRSISNSFDYNYEQARNSARLS